MMLIHDNNDDDNNVDDDVDDDNDVDNDVDNNDDNDDDNDVDNYSWIFCHNRKRLYYCTYYKLKYVESKKCTVLHMRDKWYSVYDFTLQK